MGPGAEGPLRRRRHVRPALSARPMRGASRHGVLPGFGPALGVTLLYVGLIVLVPLAALFVKTAGLSPAEFFRIVTAPRALAAYRLSFGAALAAALLNAVFGLVLALTFVGLPFVGRTVQPVLEDLDAELEEAAAVLGASRLQTFVRIVLPNLLPPLLTGFTLAFARGLGEYGSIVFVSGNMPFRTEIAPFLIVTKLEQYGTAGATAIALVLLVTSFVLVLTINALQRWTRRLAGASTVIGRGFRLAPALADAPALRRGLVATAFLFLALFLFVPLAAVFVQALAT